MASSATAGTARPSDTSRSLRRRLRRSCIISRRRSFSALRTDELRCASSSANGGPWNAPSGRACCRPGRRALEARAGALRRAAAMASPAPASSRRRGSGGAGRAGGRRRGVLAGPLRLVVEQAGGEETEPVGAPAGGGGPDSSGGGETECSETTAQPCRIACTTRSHSKYGCSETWMFSSTCERLRRSHFDASVTKLACSLALGPRRRRGRDDSATARATGIPPTARSPARAEDPEVQHVDVTLRRRDPACRSR